MEEAVKLTDQEAQEKLQQRLELINKLIEKVSEVLDENIPCAILATPEGHEIANTVMLNIFMRLSYALGYDRNTIIANIDKFFEVQQP